MNIKPILFGTPMVQAILEERKAQTRRIIKPQPGLINDKIHFNYGKEYYLTEEQLLRYSKYQKGDILWVRETWHYNDDLDEPYSYKQKEQDELKPEFFKRLKWKPSIFMPKEACRIFLEVTNVRVERLQEISEEDAIAEGIYTYEQLRPVQKIWYHDYLNQSRDLEPLESFQTLWQSINGKESWEENPFVWVYDFKRTKKPANLHTTN